MPSFYGARISKEVPEGNLMCICHAIMMSKIFSKLTQCAVNIYLAGYRNASSGQTTVDIARMKMNK